MRALCEGCGKPQPPDWKAGDLCSFCGKAVRHDVRCYWCAKWVPAAKFCRSCGAAVVEEKLYGAARMLKDAGTDRFTIPKQLKEFDPDQIENFSRIYQRHSIAVARHVDELRFLERFLFNKAYSTGLEELLVPQLPWNEERLAEMSTPPLKPGDDLATLRAIEETTPFPITKALATLVRLTKSDGDVYKDACSVLYVGDPVLKDEAVLALTSWRIAATWGRPRNMERELVETLQKSPHKLEAAVRLGQMGYGNQDLLKQALTSPDPETAFAAAFVLGNVDRLQAALKGDDLMKSVAGGKLVSLGVIKPVIQEIPKSREEIQRDLVESLLRRKEAAPEAADALIEIVEKTDDNTLRERATRLLCRELNPAWVLRILRAAKQDRHIYQNLLQAPGLPPEATVELADFLLENGRFTMNQYGMDTLAENPALPPSYVATRFGRAADDETRAELLRFAEKQLEKRPGDGLHQFVMKTVFGPYSAKVRAAAWWCLHRWYRHQGEYRGEGPFKLTLEQIRFFFGDVQDFLPKLAALLRDHDTLKEVGVYEFVANLLGSADLETIAAIQQEQAAADDLIDALLSSSKGDYWPNTLESMIVLASQIAAHPRWCDRVLQELQGLGKKGNYHYDKAVRRLELSKHGIPEESDWNNLPQDFVPSKFWSADGEGKRELLKVAEHQLIHGKAGQFDPALFRLLLQAGLKSEDADLSEQALEIHRERVPRDYQELQLTRDAVGHCYGPVDDFLAALPAVLRRTCNDQAEELSHRISPLVSRPSPEQGAFLAQAGEAGHSVVLALLDVAASTTGSSSFRRESLRFLRDVNGPEPWREEVVQALDRIRKTIGTDMVQECEMALRKLKPPEPPRRKPEPKYHPKHGEPPVEVESGPDPVVIDYMAKQKIAEKMGAELQAKMMRLMAGPGTPDEKMREGVRLSEEFQAAIKKLYGQ